MMSEPLRRTRSHSEQWPSRRASEFATHQTGGTLRSRQIRLSALAAPDALSAPCCCCGATSWQFTLGELTKPLEHIVSIIVGQAMSRNRFEETKLNMAPTDSPLASWHDVVPALNHHRDDRCLGLDRHDDRALLVRQE